MPALVAPTVDDVVLERLDPDNVLAKALLPGAGERLAVVETVGGDVERGAFDGRITALDEPSCRRLAGQASSGDEREDSKFHIYLL
jgi:hypothetical protein